MPGRGLVLALQLDLTVPEDTDHVGLYVSVERGGGSFLQPPIDLTPVAGRVRFASSLVLQGHEDGDRARVRFIAFDAAGVPRAMREARTVLPSDGIRRVDLTLRWINEGQVLDAGRGALAAGQLELTQQSASADDAFRRFSLPCPDGQTLGDEGTCVAVDTDGVPVDSVELVQPSACFSLPSCFDGDEVRVFPLHVDDAGGCHVQLDPTARTPKPALGLRDAGGELAGGAPLRVVDGVLYTYDEAAHRIDLSPALCAKVKRDNLQTAVASAKCPPKELDAPVCSPIQLAETAVPRNDGVFVGEAPPPDGGDGGAPADSGVDADTPDSSEPVPDDQNRVLAGFPTDRQQLFGFAARAGEIWLLTTLGISGPLNAYRTTFAADAPAEPVDTSVSLEPTNSQLILGPQNPPHVYVVPGSPRVINRDELITAAPRFCGEVGACGNRCDQLPVDQFTVGDLDGTNVAIGRLTSGGMQAFVARGAECFEPLGARSTTGCGVQLGTQLGQSFVAPCYNRGALLLEVDAAGLHERTATFAGLPSAPSDFGGLARFGDATAMWVVPNSSQFWRTTGSGAAWTAQDPVTADQRLSREFFGVPNLACARAPDPARLVCVLQSGGSLRSERMQLDARASNPHVYSDPQYLYVAHACTDNSVRVRGVAWQRLQTLTDLRTRFDRMCE